MLDERRICPSILAADFARLGDQVAAVMDAGARVIHVDVMDGHFVPPISIGAAVTKSLDAQVHGAGGWLDVHLMVERPERHVAEFAEAGADSISVHFEATPHVHFALKAVREAGCHAGLALNPGTPVSAVDALHGSFDHLLCMTVNPGWGGQEWIPAVQRAHRRAALAAAGRRADPGRRRRGRGHRRAGGHRGRGPAGGGLVGVRRGGSRRRLPRPGPGRGRRPDRPAAGLPGLRARAGRGPARLRLRRRATRSTWPARAT